MQRLEGRYGKPDKVLNQLATELLKMHIPNGSKSKFTSFALKLVELVDTAVMFDELNFLENSYILSNLARKLPIEYRIK